jgi:hypothetical protein
LIGRNESVKAMRVCKANGSNGTGRFWLGRVGSGPWEGLLWRTCSTIHFLKGMCGMVDSVKIEEGKSYAQFSLFQAIPMSFFLKVWAD